MIRAQEALNRLKEGNRRFASGTAVRGIQGSAGNRRRSELVTVQEPFAAILGCSDSRVPPEIVFDQGLGDLFVVRVAGNIAVSSQIGTLEFAAERLGVRLIVVLGHTGCGAVEATLEALQGATQVQSPDLRTIVDAIRPSAEEARTTGGSDDAQTLMQAVIRANVCSSVNVLKRKSEVLERLGRDEGLLVVGAEYSLESGIAELFDGGSEVI